ncbi:MAG TPA: hypothetical protein VJ874_02125 [Candidatus Thermoplasmatota archaeon]|nr:hypothetical protein [Candidatus Thermoplasmatota archaeon]
MSGPSALATPPDLPSPLTGAGGWMLLLALLKVALVGLAFLFLRMRQAAAV